MWKLRVYSIALAVFVTSSVVSADRPPNIVFVLADDLGWSELGCYGSSFNETPHLDRLAREGMRFTQAYAAAPVCSPYRASLLTGQYPARHGILDYLRPNSTRPLSTDHGFGHRYSRQLKPAFIARACDLRYSQSNVR